MSESLDASFAAGGSTCTAPCATHPALVASCTFAALAPSTAPASSASTSSSAAAANAATFVSTVAPAMCSALATAPPTRSSPAAATVTSSVAFPSFASAEVRWVV